jgi:hypothetical protein
MWTKETDYLVTHTEEKGRRIDMQMYCSTMSLELHHGPCTGKRETDSLLQPSRVLPTLIEIGSTIGILKRRPLVPKPIREYLTRRGAGIHSTMSTAAETVNQRGARTKSALLLEKTGRLREWKERAASINNNPMSSLGKTKGRKFINV